MLFTLMRAKDLCLVFGEYEGGHVLAVYLFERKYDGAMARLYRDTKGGCVI